VLLYLWLLYRRTKNTLRYASLSLVKQAMGKGPGWRRHVPPAADAGCHRRTAGGDRAPLAIVTLPSLAGNDRLAMTCPAACVPPTCCPIA
jgi:Ca-activated chloride channel family protein